MFELNPRLFGCILPLAMVLAALVTNASAQEAAQPAGPDKPANKLSIGGYHFSATGEAIDINWRHANSYGNTWLGYYHASSRDEHQARAGWDDTLEAGSVRITPSAQIASRGYIAWSVNVEAGQTWFVGAGFGRTNLQSNWNLNFDPNDSYTLSAGRRWADGRVASLQWVRDNRENPDQRHLHVNYRLPLAGGERMTIDILRKQGLVDAAMIRKLGATFTYDWPRYFVRLAYDPKVNFTPENMWRLVIGTRF